MERGGGGRDREIFFWSLSLSLFDIVYSPERSLPSPSPYISLTVKNNNINENANKWFEFRAPLFKQSQTRPIFGMDGRIASQAKTPKQATKQNR